MPGPRDTKEPCAFGVSGVQLACNTVDHWHHNERQLKGLLSSYMNAVLVDTVRDVENLRKWYIDRKQRSPPILARDGTVLRARGQFGGSRNRVPAVGKLHFCVGARPTNVDPAGQ